MHLYRQSITIATAGHVDHGKTSLVSKITGIDTDTLADEKARGLSINLGFAYHRIPQPDLADGQSPNEGNLEHHELSIGFVDVPGHTDFINNALAGIGTADYALLIVAADDGVMPQTREHLAIISQLGIRGGAIAVTKVDKASPERISEVEEQVTQLVKATSLEGTRVFRVSSQSGQGIDALIDHLSALAREIASQPIPADHNARFAIDRSFTVKGIGTVVTGTVVAGEIRGDLSLVHSGSGRPVRVKGLRHNEHSIERALAGERIAINLNLPHQQLSRGDWLVDESLYRPTNRIDTRLTLLEPADFKSGVSYHFYHGTGHQLVQVRKLEDASSGVAYHQLTSSTPFHAHHGDRFILRDPACVKTLGGGVVVDVFVPRRGKNSDQRLQALRSMDQDDLPALCALIATKADGVDLHQFATARNCSEEKVSSLLEQLSQDQIAFVTLKVGGAASSVILGSDHFHGAEQQILTSLASYHQENQNQAGVAEPNLNKLVNFTRSHNLFHAICEQLLSNGQIRRTGTLLHLPDHQARLSQEERSFLDKVRPILTKAGFLPPRTRELVEMTGMQLGALERVLAGARRSGNLVQVATNRHYLPETMVELAEFTETLAQEQDEGFTVIQFRDRLGIGRNLCIEILEYFDRIGFTYRDGNSRHLRTSKDNLFGAPTTESESDRSGVV